MTTIVKTRAALTVLLNVVLMASLSACGGADTSADAPNPNITNNNQQSPTLESDRATTNDAQSETRKKQVDADIRAREQRNDMTDYPQKRTEGDLSSEVRSMLEANIPSSKLTVTAKDSEVTVSGAVKTQQELDQIEPLAMKVTGVNRVVVTAVVTP